MAAATTAAARSPDVAKPLPPDCADAVVRRCRWGADGGRSPEYGASSDEACFLSCFFFIFFLGFFLPLFLSPDDEDDDDDDDGDGGVARVAPAPQRPRKPPLCDCAKTRSPVALPMFAEKAFSYCDSS